MIIEIVNNDIVLKNTDSFKLCDIFDCGQCFRFNRLENGDYIGTAFEKTIRISQNEDTVVLHNTTAEDFENVWYHFFDLDRDYSKIKQSLLKADDDVIRSAIEYGSGIRILKQDLWETIISFIISASNNIPRIKGIIERLCKEFGVPHEYEGNTYYSFPSAHTIAALDKEALSSIRAGFREKYILKCAQLVDSGEFDLVKLFTLSTADAKKELMSLSGIGNKVSDCILLFALGRFDSFPVDVWIKRIMEYCYFKNTEQTIPTISDFAKRNFGENGGIAQQYLFYYARSLHIGT